MFKAQQSYYHCQQHLFNCSAERQDSYYAGTGNCGEECMYVVPYIVTAVLQEKAHQTHCTFHPPNGSAKVRSHRTSCVPVSCLLYQRQRIERCFPLASGRVSSALENPCLLVCYTLNMQGRTIVLYADVARVLRQQQLDSGIRLSLKGRMYLPGCFWPAKVQALRKPQ